jgi:hypothetical protein
MAKKQKIRRLFLMSSCLLLTVFVQAQFSLIGQLRTRTEVRDGLGNLVPKGSKPAVFTSQRTRLTFGYKWDRVTFGAAVQDIRVWGQDASTISNADGAKLMLHEGWADITLANSADTTIKFKAVESLSIKIGRQELIYDDVRLIGNLDWLQQARRHDMALLKMMHKGWQVDIGYAFNQNSDAFGITGTSYVPVNVPQYVKNSAGVLVPTPAGIVPLTTGGSMANNSSKTGAPVWMNPSSTNAATQDYKSFASLYISRKIKQTKFSALFFNDQFGKYKLDSVAANGGYVYGRRFVSAGGSDVFDYSGTSRRYTYGLMINHTMGNASGFGKIALQAAYYHQSGKDRDGVSLDGYHYTVAATYQKGKFSFTPGYDVLSGNDAVSPSGKNNRFDPLYGTPHRHWGYMDYFYVGTGSPAGGLNNAYFKAKYTANVFSFGIDYHYFALHKDMKKADGTVIGKRLGSEVDVLLNYTLNKFTGIELGYSIMSATKSMPFAKGQATTDAVADTYRKSGSWLYLMINIRPDFFFAKPVAIKQ